MQTLFSSTYNFFDLRFAASGVSKGAGTTEAAGCAAQGRDAEDHLPSALVQSSPAEAGVPRHEEGSHLDPGKHRYTIYLISHINIQLALLTF